MVTWKEQLAFAPLENADRGEEVGRRLRHAIELGVLEDGSQLPSESYLASRMGVSTLTLRAALAEFARTRPCGDPARQRRRKFREGQYRGHRPRPTPISCGLFS
ncbi:GntR family transcriptional regulator [Arthrobacter sp. OAP107]|uniref:GntR family transcriptional regulator n=1 Tax=Arthrobacter sp. OAP107 TaxID=3156445 RepID=UPI0033957E5C